LKNLEEEEDKLLRMELEEDGLMGDGDEDLNEEGVTEEDLKRALKEVRGKKCVLKMKHKMKRNLRARSRNKNLDDLEEHLEKLGINVNKDSLKARVKTRKGIAELEDN